MSWFRIEGRMPQHRKVAPLSDAAFRLHITAGAWSTEEGTDGLIPARVVSTLTAAPRGAKLTAVLKELKDNGLWEDGPGGYQIHDYLQWNMSAAELAARREAKAIAGQAGGKRSCEQRRSRTEADASNLLKQRRSKSEALSHSGSDPNPDPKIPAIVEQEPDISDSDLASFTPGVPQPFKQEVLEVFEAWRLATGHPNARLDAKRRTRILARLREGFTVVQLVDAVKHRVNDPFLMGSSGRIYDGIETLLRDAAQVERLVALTKPIQVPQGKPHGFVQHEQRQQQERSTANQKLFAPEGAEARRALRKRLYEAARAGQYGKDAQTAIAVALDAGTAGKQALSAIVDGLEKAQRSEPTGLGELLEKVGT